MIRLKDALKELREGENLTQEQLAEKLNISKSAIAGYEQGRRKPDLETTVKIAEFFGVTLDFLVKYE